MVCEGERKRGEQASLLKKLILHLGAHRCGSTAIQSLLGREREALGARQVRVFLRSDMVGGSLDLRRLHRYRAYNPLWRGKLSRAVSAIDAMEENIVIVSDENLMGTMPFVRGKAFYPHFSTLMQGVEALARLSAGRFTLSPRLVIRRQDHYLESVYAFRVSRGLPLGFDGFVKAFAKRPISWLRLAQQLSALPEKTEPKVTALEAWPKGSAATGALEFFDVPAGVEPGVARLTGNRRHAPQALALMLAFNKAGIDWRGCDWFREVAAAAETADADSLIKHFAEHVTRKQLARFERAFSPSIKLTFGDEERKHLLSGYADENRQLLALPVVVSLPDVWD